jgi:hypothetical protein
VTELFEAGGDPEPDEPVRMTRVLERYVSLLEHELTGSEHGAAPMPGVPALLERLGRSGAVLGLLTGNVVPGARLKLRAARIDWEQFVVGALSAGLSCRAIASQKRPQFHAQSSRTFGGAPRLEHVIVFERTAPAPREKGALGVRKKSSRPTRR